MAGETGGGDAGGPKSKPPQSSARYIIFVGVAFAALITVATINTFRNPPSGLLGVSADVKGRALPEFAVPNVRSSLVGDANIFQDDCSSSQNPCPASDARASACQVHLPGAIRVCDFFDKPLAISFWFMRGASCLPAEDAFDRVARRYGDRVGFLSIDIRDDRDAVRKVAAEHGWTVPVGWDRDGAVSDLYRVGGCPTVAFAYPGGIYASARASVDRLTVPKLSADVRGLLADTRRRAAASR
jgi:hypothetical protein